MKRFLFLFLFSSSLVGAVDFPSTTPTGETPGGVFYQFFRNATENPCPVNHVVMGFQSGALDFMTPRCVAMEILAGGWLMSGNAGTVPGIQFLGTQDAQPLIIKTSSLERVIIDANGNVGIGILSPTSKLHVSGGDAIINFARVGNGPNNNSSNTVLGSNSFLVNTGFYNTAIGGNTLTANTTGVNNTAGGYGSLYSNTTGYYNTANGYASLFSNTTGYYNSAYGMYSLYKNETGVGNVANGMYSLYSNTGGIYNTANGYASLFSNTTGNYNTANGMYSFYDSVTGSYNTILGYAAGMGIVTGSNNTIIGANVTGLAAGTSNTIIIADGSGNRRINVDSNGKMGIGTTTPGAKLSIYNSVNQPNGAGKLGSVLQIGQTLATTDEGPAIDFNLRWGGGYEDNNLNTGWIGGRIGSVYDSSVGNGGALVFHTNGGAGANGGASSSQVTEKMRIAPNGNVGIGTTSPTEKLHINGTMRVDGSINCIGGYCPTNGAVRLTPNLHLSASPGYAVIANWDTGTTGANYAFRVGNGASSDAFIARADGYLWTFQYGWLHDKFLSKNSDTLSEVYNNGWYRSNGATGWYNQTYGGGIYMSDTNWIRTYGSKGFYHDTGIMRTDGEFHVGGAGARFVVNTAGNVGIGVPVPTEKLDIGGNVKATAFLYSSDRRLKTNITPLSSVLTKIDQIHGVSFDWKKTGEHDIGVIAQDVESVFPEAVQTGSDGYKTVDYARLVPVLLEAIKEQQKQINELKKTNPTVILD